MASIKEQIALYLVNILEGLSEIKTVRRRLVEFKDGKVQLGTSDYPAAVVVEQSFVSEGLGDVPYGGGYDLKRTSVDYLVVIYCAERSDSEITLNAIEAAIAAAVEADQTLGGLAQTAIVAQAIRDDAGRVNMTGITIRVRYQHDPGVL